MLLADGSSVFGAPVVPTTDQSYELAGAADATSVGRREEGQECPPRTVVLIGCGSVGRIVLRHLRKRKDLAAVVVIEPNKDVIGVEKCWTGTPQASMASSGGTDEEPFLSMDHNHSPGSLLREQVDSSGSASGCGLGYVPPFAEEESFSFSEGAERTAGGTRTGMRMKRTEDGGTGNSPRAGGSASIEDGGTG